MPEDMGTFGVTLKASSSSCGLNSTKQACLNSTKQA